MPLRHIVLFRVHDGVEPDLIAEAVDGLKGLADLPGILEWTVRLSADERKGVVIVENALFESSDALQAFSDDPEHRISAERLSRIANWWVGDYLE